VECAGRADDQVKIRGFRIELGEIDTYLSQHPLVRENVTLVRRDKDEEPTLVSYIVPQQGRELTDLVMTEDELIDVPNDELVKGLRKYRKLIREIRDHLKSKLPSYAVPTGLLHPPLSLINSFRSPVKNASEPEWKSR
jgi:L-2-aminoadipate reductase